MKKLLLVTALLSSTSFAFAQAAPTDKIAVTVTRAELQLIGQGLMELQYKNAAPVMNDLQAQVDANDKAVAKAAADAKAKAEEKPADATAK